MEFFEHSSAEVLRFKIIDALIQKMQSGDEVLNALVTSAAQVMHVPIALVTFVHRQQLLHLSRFGLEAESSDVDQSFCMHHLADAELMEISDTTLDLKFLNNPNVVGDMHIRFYAGAPLVVDGVPIGRLCVLDKKPRVLNTHQRQNLMLMAEAASEYVQGIYSEVMNRFKTNLS